MWHLYIVKCADGTLYTGVTMDVARRIEEHNGSAKGARYTRTRRPVTLLASCQTGTRSEALKAEHALKRLSRAAKLSIVNHLDDGLSEWWRRWRAEEILKNLSTNGRRQSAVALGFE